MNSSGWGVKMPPGQKLVAGSNEIVIQTDRPRGEGWKKIGVQFGMPMWQRTSRRVITTP